MRKKLLSKNVSSTLISEVTALICGFILPRLFLSRFGSEVNGLTQSIVQFLQIITFLQLGIDAVVESSLYKPLAEKDPDQISRIMTSANRFLKKVSAVLLVYIAVLVLVYPPLAAPGFDRLYTITLILAISINTFGQYYFGMANSMILNADQRGYINHNSITIATIVNTIVCALLISQNYSVQIVKLVSSLIFIIRSVLLRIYVTRRYQINWNAAYSKEPIQQKWNGIAQHIAFLVLEHTDVVVLTLFSTLSNVSIYSVYFMIVDGIKRLLLSVSKSTQGLLGELWAKEEYDRLSDVFSCMEWSIHVLTTFIFSCVAALIVPFVKVYTFGINDAEYVQPVFALILTFANAMHCYRLPYNIMVLATGRYKETQNSFFFATALNVVISILLVRRFGLTGVAIGTLLAMSYHTIRLAYFNSKELIHWPMKNAAKQLLSDIVCGTIIVALSQFFTLSSLTYFSWFILAVKVAAISFIITAAVNVIFHRDRIKLFLTIVRQR